MADKPDTLDDSVESVNVLDAQYVPEYPVTPEGIAERDLLLDFKMTSWEMTAILRALIEQGRERLHMARIGVEFCKCPKCNAVDHAARRVTERMHAMYKSCVPQHLPPDAADLEEAQEAKAGGKVN